MGNAGGMILLVALALSSGVTIVYVGRAVPGLAGYAAGIAAGMVVSLAVRALLPAIYPQASA